MTERQSGLRFDIYERVHLQEEARGIRELDEIELVPNIQVVSQSDHAVLKGHLRLHGTYTAEEEEGTKPLEHQIPVEITLPLSRVGNAQELSVEIENFDVDLLSPRSLNVTGVLSLHGVETAVQAQSPEWNAEEETVFVHRADENAETPAAEPAAELSGGQDEPAQPRAAEPPGAVPIGQAQTAAFTPHPIFVQTAGTAETEAFAAAEPERPLDVKIDVSAEETDAISFTQNADEAELLPEVELHSEKKDVKVAFGSKKVAELAQEATYGIKSLLQKSSSIFLDRRNRATEAAEQPAAQPQAQETVEWKKLFLNASADGQEFRKLKLAIVQKEETLETIAQRYQLNPRELQLLNRLQDGEISVGQVIFIPR